MVFSLRLLFRVVSRVPVSCPIPDFYAGFPALYAEIPPFVFSTFSTAHGTRVGGWGVPWVAWRSPWPCTSF